MIVAVLRAPLLCRRSRQDDDRRFHVWMQLAKIMVGAGFGKDVLPRAGGVETFGIEGLVGRRHRVGFVVLVDEGDAVAYVDRQCRRTVLEIFDMDRGDGRKERRGSGSRAGGQAYGQQHRAQSGEECVHVGAYAAAGIDG